jgi:hypothetical protein
METGSVFLSSPLEVLRTFSNFRESRILLNPVFLFTKLRLCGVFNLIIQNLASLNPKIKSRSDMDAMCVQVASSLCGA